MRALILSAVLFCLVCVRFHTSGAASPTIELISDSIDLALSKEGLVIGFSIPGASAFDYWDKGWGVNGKGN